MNARWALLAVPVVVGLPYWLPPAVVALRVRIFAAINGDTGMTTPSADLPIAGFKRLYGHPAANGRSRGAALSDLFWYWLAPGAEVHQEHLEPGPRYDDVARTTRRILARLGKPEWAELVGRCTRRVLDEYDTDGRIRSVRLRDLMMPIWAEVYYELVFRQPCPVGARDLITGNADDVVSSLKCTRLRHMDRRARLTAYLRKRIAADRPPEPLPATLSPDEQAYYLQGTFFNTAVVQMSEAMAHLLLAIATHPAVQERLSAAPDDEYLDRVIDETLWHYPLFGIAHRITTAEIASTADHPVIPSGSVLLFDYPRYQQGAGHQEFDPDRWIAPESKPPHYIPFGIPANRPCPARGFATLTMRVCAREVLRRYRLDSAAQHTRSLPNRGPCLLTPRAIGTRRPTARLMLMRLCDRWESLPRSMIQLVYGSWMVWDARRKQLCGNYFADREVGVS